MPLPPAQTGRLSSSIPSFDRAHKFTTSLGDGSLSLIVFIGIGTCRATLTFSNFSACTPYGEEIWRSPALAHEESIRRSTAGRRHDSRDRISRLHESCPKVLLAASPAGLPAWFATALTIEKYSLSSPAFYCTTSGAAQGLAVRLDEDAAFNGLHHGVTIMMTR